MTSGKLNASIVKLDGTQYDADGNITRENFFDFLNIPLEEYDDIEREMTAEQAVKFRNRIIRTKIGISAAMPLLCGGPAKCPTGKQCPLLGVKKYPIGKRCPLEVSLIQAQTKSYISDLSIDPQSVTQMSLVNRLVELDILDHRANVGLAGGKDEEAPTLLKTTISESEKGGITETVNTHPLLDAKSKFHYERMRILEALVSTPREKYKKAQAIGQKQETDAAQYMADLNELVNKMKNRASKENSLEAIKQEAKQLQEDNEKNNIITTDWEADDF